MGPSTKPTTFESCDNTNVADEPPQPIEGRTVDGPLPPDLTPLQNAPKVIPTTVPKYEHRNFQDILSYEDKWIGWDGPVWCNRYGRFENKAQAAEDDGYTSSRPVAHQNSEAMKQIQQCQREGCACRVPFEHRSYVKDIQRRIEPMTASLVALEHQVGKLLHHIVKDGEHVVLDAFNHEDGKERFAMHSDDGRKAVGPKREHLGNQHMSTGETIASLEGKVHSLTHQLHMLVKQNDKLIRNGQAAPGEHHYWQVPQ